MWQTMSLTSSCYNMLTLDIAHIAHFQKLWGIQIYFWPLYMPSELMYKPKIASLKYFAQVGCAFRIRMKTPQKTIPDCQDENHGALVSNNISINTQYRLSPMIRWGQCYLNTSHHVGWCIFVDRLLQNYQNTRTRSLIMLQVIMTKWDANHKF